MAWGHLLTLFCAALGRHAPATTQGRFHPARRVHASLPTPALTAEFTQGGRAQRGDAGRGGQTDGAEPRPGKCDHLCTDHPQHGRESQLPRCMCVYVYVPVTLYWPS